MATTQPVTKYTYEDYRTTPDDERYELIDGDLIMVPAPNVKHQQVQGNLYYHLRGFITEHGLGVLLAAPCDVFSPTRTSCSRTSCSSRGNARTRCTTTTSGERPTS